jgi:Uma2 family endonuclease
MGTPRRKKIPAGEGGGAKRSLSHAIAPRPSIGATAEPEGGQPWSMREEAGAAYGAPRGLPTTQAAEGIPRLRWTLAEFERLCELGIFTEEDRIELIDGELVPMSPKGNRHEVVRHAILNWLRRTVPNEFDLCVEPGWRVDGSYCEPDFLVGPAECNPTTVSPQEVALLIEVSDTSRKKDTGIKSRLYARAGVRDYWVVNARSLSTRVHRVPSGRGYGMVVNVACAKALTSLVMPSLSLRLADLPIA